MSMFACSYGYSVVYDLLVMVIIVTSPKLDKICSHHDSDITIGVALPPLLLSHNCFAFFHALLVQIESISAYEWHEEVSQNAARVVRACEGKRVELLPDSSISVSRAKRTAAARLHITSRNTLELLPHSPLINLTFLRGAAACIAENC